MNNLVPMSQSGSRYKHVRCFVHESSPRSKQSKTFSVKISGKRFKILLTIDNTYYIVYIQYRSTKWHRLMSLLTDNRVSFLSWLKLFNQSHDVKNIIRFIKILTNNTITMFIFISTQIYDN